MLLPNAQLRVLLHLILARVEKKPVHKHDLGARGDQGFKGISELRNALASLVPGRRKIIENEHQKEYWLSDDVEIGTCNIDALVAIGDHQITKLAERLRELRKPKP